MISAAAICAALVIMMSYLNAPIADDIGFVLTAQKLSLFDFLHNCMLHTGRIGQWGTIYAFVKLFGENAVRVFPLVAYVVLSGLSAVILWRTGLVKKLTKSIPLSMLIWGALLFCLPSIFDSFLWFDSAAAYIMSIIFALLLILQCNEFYLAKNKKSYVWRLGLIALTAFMAPLFSEPTSMLMIGFAILFGAWRIVVKKDRGGKLWLHIVMCLALIGGFALLYFSPGSIERRAANTSEFDAKYVFVDSLSGYEMVFGMYASVAKIVLLVFVALCAAHYVDKRAFKFKYLPFVIAFGLICTYGVFWINNYSQGYMPYRVLTVPSICATLVLLYLAVLIVGRIKTEKSAFAYSMAALGCLACVAVVWNMGGTIRPLALRRHFYDYRDWSVKAQLESDDEVIYIPELPILLRANAEDFYYYQDENGESKMIWVAKTYIDYIGAGNKECVLVELPGYGRKQ